MLAIVPVKGLDGAKTRLAPLLSPDERARLVVEMLDRVLSACAEADAIERTLLVTPDPGLAPRGRRGARGRRHGARGCARAALADPRAADGALVVMADCPLVDRRVAGRARDGGPAAGARPRPGRRRQRARALAPLNGFRPRFGVPAETTVAEARAAGLEPVVVDDPALALDVDRPEDYELLLARA